MTRTLAILALTLLIASLGWISWSDPYWLSDGNAFLKGFVSQDFLAVLGVIVTITLASAASLHLELNRLEDAYGEAFAEARAATRNYAYMLVVLFFAALALLILKPVYADDVFKEAAFNSGAVVIMVLNLMALADLTTAVFQIPSRRRIGRDNTAGSVAKG